MNQKDTIQVVHSLYRHEKSIGGLFQRLRPHIAPFHKLLPLIPQGSQVLDVGCGSGLWTGLLVVTGQARYCYGFDASRKSIDVALRMKNNLPKDQQDKLHYEYRSISEGLPDKPFEVVTMIDVMHHIPPNYQESALLYVWSSVKPGGLFLYKDMSDKPFYCGIMNRLHDLASVREWIHYYPFTQVIDGLINNGGEIVSEINSLQPESCRCFFWYQHEWAVFRKRDVLS